MCVAACRADPLNEWNGWTRNWSHVKRRRKEIQQEVKLSKIFSSLVSLFIHLWLVSFHPDPACLFMCLLCAIHFGVSKCHKKEFAMEFFTLVRIISEFRTCFDNLWKWQSGWWNERERPCFAERPSAVTFRTKKSTVSSSIGRRECIKIYNEMKLLLWKSILELSTGRRSD